MYYIMSLQDQDSQSCISAKPHTVDNTHNIKVTRILVPIAVTGVTALYVNDNYIITQKYDMQDAFSQKVDIRSSLTTI